MSVLPPTYLRVRLYYTAGMQLMSQQREIHQGRMRFLSEIVKLQGKVINFSRELRGNLAHSSQGNGVNLEI